VTGPFFLNGKRRDMVQATDVFVVGGGPAGLAAAIAASKKGFHVTVADGAEPPIDKACGEGLLPDSAAALRELGVVIHGSDGFAFRRIRFVSTGSSVEAPFPGDVAGIGVRRPVLHQRLVDRAQSLGVSLLWRAPVTGISGHNVSVGGDVVRARWIVGADGIGSRVRKWSGLDVGARAGKRFAHRRHYRVRPWSESVEIYWGENAQAYVTPVAEDEVGVVLISRDAGVGFSAMAMEFPQLARRLRAAEGLAKGDRGAVTMMRRLPRVYRGNVVLIGDASGSVDAITGVGLCLGFRQALALGEALEGGDLRRYAVAHRRLARRPAMMGRLMILLDGRTQLRERTIRALASDANLFARLLAIHVGVKSSAHHVASAGAMLGWRFVAA
jgi:flavin-dependent dehydrogenase